MGHDRRHKALLVLAAVFGVAVALRRRDVVPAPVTEPYRANHCGRVHLGPICVNGGDKRQPICEACGRNVTKAEREQMQRTWDAVHKMLDRHKPKPKREKR